MGKEKRQSPSTLLWFIRHKSYVPISEIRRRFFVESDEGTFIEIDNHRRAFIGLPTGTAQSIEKLWKQGKIGLEFSVEFDCGVLIGVYPMQPSKEHLNGNSHGVHPHTAVAYVPPSVANDAGALQTPVVDVASDLSHEPEIGAVVEAEPDEGLETEGAECVALEGGDIVALTKGDVNGVITSTPGHEIGQGGPHIMPQSSDRPADVEAVPGEGLGHGRPSYIEMTPEVEGMPREVEGMRPESNSPLDS
jgi:hypothetical protein